jgi:hypothetical protein
MTASARPFGGFVACLYGPIIWAVHFFIVYGAESVVCMGASSPTSAMRWTVVAATAMALIAIAVSHVRSVRAGRFSDGAAQRFLGGVAGWLAILSAAAIVAVTAAAMRLSACMSPFG